MAASTSSCSAVRNPAPRPCRSWKWADGRFAPRRIRVRPKPPFADSGTAIARSCPSERSRPMNEMTRAAAAQSDPVIRDRIEGLLCAYNHAIDDGDIDQWPGFFTEDCVYHITNREAQEAGHPIGILRCVGRGMMLDRVKAFHTANVFEPHSYNHILGRSSITHDRAPDVYA